MRLTYGRVFTILSIQADIYMSIIYICFRRDLFEDTNTDCVRDDRTGEFKHHSLEDLLVTIYIVRVL